MCKAKIRNKIGLSIYEIVAIIVIIGIVAMIAVPAVNATITNSNDIADSASEQQIIAAASRFAADTKLYDMATISVAALVAKGYLEASPKWSQFINSRTCATIKVNNSTGEVTVTLD